ncbi:uncharacterized protein LOC113359870 [Papaver somniferum]|uniref:uncharacterized protein LOC113359870 n=1 Tax=Papaver somniferum TaxID=3469 RepID=UPI000E6F6193|nr:uncharacterized protein LOC113359870 [Papaver somniferum]
MRCTQVQRKHLAVFQLSGEARKWWNNASIGLNLDTLTYIQFCERLDARYFPATVRDKKINEFAKVAQIRGELVDDYLDRYIRLSRFAMFMIPDEEKFARKFERGLGDHIRSKVVSHCFPTFQQVFESARDTEDDWLRHKKNEEDWNMTENRSKKGNNRQKHEDSADWKRQRNENYNDKDKKVGDVRPFPFHCFNCKEIGYKKVDCPKPIKHQRHQNQYKGGNKRNPTQGRFHALVPRKGNVADKE